MTYDEAEARYRRQLARFLRVRSLTRRYLRQPWNLAPLWRVNREQRELIKAMKADARAAKDEAP